MKLFQKRKRPSEIAPQLSAWQREAMRWPGPPPGGLAEADIRAMTRDGMIQTALDIKKRAVLAADGQIIAASDSPEDRTKAEFVEEMLDRMQGSPTSVVEAALDSMAAGWSVQEVVRRAERGRVWIEAVRPKNPWLFGLDVDAYGTVKSLLLKLPGESERALPRHRFLIHRSRPDYAHPRGQSELETVYPHWKAKQSLLAAWKVHLERFAMPTVLGRYERGLPSEEQASILNALQNIQNSTAIVYPSEIEIGSLGGGKEGSAGFMDAVEFHNREIARALLGQTLTSDEGRRSGSLALAQVHLKVLMLQVEAMRKVLADELITEQLIRPLVEENFGPGRAPRFRWREAGSPL
jgi:phage gp29-like protein